VKEVIYLAVSRSKVERMTKNLPDLKRGEIPVKLVVEVDAGAFREPVIERHVKVADWREGTDITDVELREAVITEAEAAIIRARRLAAMQEVLIAHGWDVVPPEDDEDATEGET
jgi:hypothetical protein